MEWISGQKHIYLKSPTKAFAVFQEKYSNAVNKKQNEEKHCAFLKTSASNNKNKKCEYNSKQKKNIIHLKSLRTICVLYWKGTLHVASDLLFFGKMLLQLARGMVHAEVS